MSPPPTRDYGVSPKAGMSRQAKMTFIGGAAVALAAAGAVLAHNWWEQRKEAIANADAWTIAGPPCPELTEAQFAAAGLKTRKSTEYNGIVFGRVAGHLTCNEVVNDGGKGLGKYAVCQFTAPSVLTVTAGEQAFYFRPGVGQDATVEVKDGQAKCVMAGRFAHS